MSAHGERDIGLFEPRASLALRVRAGVLALLLAVACHPLSVQACAACYGKSDSPMAKGMNWGIFSLLAVVAMVLGSVAAFFVFLARRANAQPEPELEPLLESPDPII